MNFQKRDAGNACIEINTFMRLIDRHQIKADLTRKKKNKVINAVS